MAKSKILIDLRIISKLFFLIYIVYANVVSYSLFFVRGLSSVLLIGALGVEILCDGNRIKKNRSFLVFVIFAIYILGSGALVAVDYNLVISTAKTFIESLIVFFLILSYVNYDKDVVFVMNVFIAQALLAAAIVTLNGVGVKRVSIAASVNANTIGVMLSFAIGFVLYLLIKDTQNFAIMIISIGCVTFLLLGILLTVSKKGIFSAVAMILFWMLLCYRLTLKRIKPLYRILIFVALIAIALFVYGWYTTNFTFQIQILKKRMSQLYTGESDQNRIRLFFEGFSIFFSHPLLGVGFNNSRFYSFKSTYTHSLYAEVFACTGIIGAFIFFFGLLDPFRQIARSIKKFQDIERIKIKYILIMFIVLLVLCFAQILFYQATLMYIFSVLTAFSAINATRNIE